MSEDKPAPESRDEKEGAAIAKSGLDKSSLRSVFVILGVIGSLASLISIPLAIYFYFQAKEYPQLTSYVSPTKAVVVKAGQASRLTASYDNKVIDTDITAAQVALWNGGSKPIKSTDILKPIVIRTDNNIPILEATIRKTSREVTQLAINTEELQKGLMYVSWNILEHNDGGVVQLIYAGNPDVKIYTDGVIEGQPQIVQQAGGATTQGDRFTAYFSFGMGTLSLAFYVIGCIKFGWLRWKDDWPMIFLILMFFIGGTVLFYITRDVGPPFGF